MDMIRGKLKIIEDKRHTSYIEHKLVDVLIIVMCAVMSGIEELGEIVTYAKSKSEFLKNTFGIEKAPSKATLSRILSMVNAEEVSKIIIDIMLEGCLDVGDIIAVDGKAIRSTSKKGKPHTALQILTAYCTETGVILGQEAINDKTNEIPVFQEMLNVINIENKTITADALHCQKNTCEKIIEHNGNYIFGLKENHKTFYEDVDLFMKDKMIKNEFESFTTTEKNGGRIEIRECVKIDSLDWLECKDDWCGLSSVFAIKRTTETKYNKSEEISYYITSLDCSAEKLLKYTREHWKIESLHWLLDVVFSEDKTPMISENGLKTLNIFRKLALLAHKRFISTLPKKESVKGNILKCLLDDERLTLVIKNL